MRAADLERIIENKYSLLLFFLISLALISIVSTSNALVHFIIDGVLSMIVFVIMLKILKAHRFLFGLYVTLGFLALLFHFLSVFVFHSTLSELKEVLRKGFSISTPAPRPRQEGKGSISEGR